MGNVVTAVFERDTHARTEAVWQYDYGMILRFDGIELPEIYEVHFSDTNKGFSKTMLGNAEGVAIPDEFLLSGKQVYAWIYLHTGTDDGETEYCITIPVNKRAQPTNDTPTSVEQSAIAQAIAALGIAVEECQGCVEHYPKIVNDIWYVWDADTGDFVSTGIDANGLKGDTGPYFTPDVSVSGIISWTNNGGLPNPSPVNLANTIHLDDYALKTEVAQDIGAVETQVSGKINSSEKGTANGVATLDANGLIPSAQIPSYYDDVVEAISLSQFPRTGEYGKIYVSTSNNTMYRWTGSTYTPVGSLFLGETSSTAYRGDRGKIAYDHAANRGGQFNLGLYKIQTNAEGHVSAASVVSKTDIANTGYGNYEYLASAANFDFFKGNYYSAVDNYLGDIRPGQTHCFFESRISLGRGTQTIIWMDGKRSTRTCWGDVFGEWHTEE